MSAEILDSGKFESRVIEAKETALVDFYADWCMPCKLFGPILDSLSAELEGKVKCYKINVDKEPDLAAKYGVMSIPTAILFNGGEKIDSFTGSLPKEKVKSFLEKNLGGL